MNTKPVTRFFATSSKPAPSEPHFAIMHYSKVHIPGDERSQTHPGHGYGAHTVDKIDYQVFLVEDEWKAEVANLSARKYGDTFTAIRATPAKVTTTVNVSVE